MSNHRSNPRLLALTLSAATIIVPCVGWSSTRGDSANSERRTITGFEFIGEVSFPTGYRFDDTEVGGLSGITYDADDNRFLALSDDRSDLAPARYYSLTIDLSDGHLDSGDIAFTGVTKLQPRFGSYFAPGGIDPEGIALAPNGGVFVSSEGDASKLLAPFVNHFNRFGIQDLELEIDAKYLPTATSGIRNNLAFESLNLSPNKRYLFTAVENALVQDGPQATLEDKSLSRILKYDLKTGKALGEMVYEVEPVAETPEPATAFATNGLVELLALDDNGSLLAMERGFSTGKGNVVKLYQVLSQGALDVSAWDSLLWKEEGVPFSIDPPVQKQELLDFGDLVETVDNLEGMTLGPVLPDGRQSLIVVSDNNFSSTQFTQFIALALNIETVPAARPVLETPRTTDAGTDSPLRGDSDDPAIWIHPSRPDKSLVIATLKDGGFVVFDLGGTVIQQEVPAEYGDIRFNNVDLVYDFALDGKRVDLAVFSDRKNDTLAVYRIDPNRQRLVAVTSSSMPATIFGVDDGSATAYGLCTYRGLSDGADYAFVTQADGNKIAQLRLLDAGDGTVSAEVARMIELPVPTGDAEDSQSEGMVADRELGVLYVAMEDIVGVLKFSAEVDGGNDYSLVQSIDAHFLKPDIEGLTLYYGPGGTGYLLVSSQGDSTYAVFERSGDNAYVGSFVVADTDGIDQANESDGADIISTALGSRYPFGLLVVQDGANDPQNALQDEEELENDSTNFKFIPWENVAKSFPEPLIMEPRTYDPRQ
ncbi:3-phytase [Thiorhodococcus drewsii AZ1]|uniref:3-phytase n=1 Tax=Thiorhodococcus drewsii AZ1 TaxID=765913 RepID=G2E7J1_9GAMM|nr:phytase [Thiorhodococcus drewsii]EGV27924.1 3-phytase [Thiorhodococcus drewsii AZ1]